MQKGRETYAQVAVGLPVGGPFTYLIPEKLKEQLKAGMRVSVPFRTRNIIGYVTGFTAQCPPGDVKHIESLIDTGPVISGKLLELCHWISGYYFCSPGEAVEAALPWGVKKGRVSMAPRSGDVPGCEFRLEPEVAHTARQAEAIRRISSRVKSGGFECFLLHGVTGSGKTEVYAGVIKAALEAGKGAILLVPEISLTPQTQEKLSGRLGSRVHCMHSRMTQAQRFAAWEEIRKLDSPVVIGPRSAVFAPVKSPGVIIVDEEHESSYKQEESPRYNGRDVAVMRAKMENAAAVLGSATPSLESFHNCRKGKYCLLELPERVEERNLPAVEVVDMKREFTKTKKRLIFSEKLESEIHGRLQKKEQVILFLNRRGFSSSVSCPECGYVAKCKYCSVTLTHHLQEKKLVCHYCEFRMTQPASCPECGCKFLGYRGTGTERLESEIGRLFPGAAVSRLDTDAARKRGSADKLLSDFRKGASDILVGTQMVAKGLDFPNVTLVGVIDADTALNFPDFRSAEKTFQLLTQVAGRSGRGKKEGEVVVQTYMPENYCIETASRHDYAGFVKKELEFRKQLAYPPFSHIACVVVRGKDEDEVCAQSERLRDRVKGEAPKGILVLGPSPMPLGRIKTMYRWGITLKSGSAVSIGDLLRLVMRKYRIPSSVKVSVDIDPADMM